MIFRDAAIVPRTLPEGPLRIPLICVVVIGATLLLTLSAKIQVPFFPVPMTLQTGVVLLIGIALGPAFGALTVSLYLLQGAMGLPVFAGTPEKGLGLAYLLGPTGGYLIGFVPAAYIAGWTAQKTSALLTQFAGYLVAMSVIYGSGVLWLSNFLAWDKVFELGVLPFLLGDLVKVVLVVLIAGVAPTHLRRGHS